MPPSGGLILVALTAVNLVNFCDRGITPGAPAEFSHFINETLDVPLEETGTWLGALVSSFIVCYSIASLIFGKLMQIAPKFRLLSGGLIVWTLALFGSGVAYYLPRDRFGFWWFFCFRALSGVGEAAFQCIIPPYVEDFAPPGKKSLWLGAFYTAIPCGTALGYLYGSILAPSPPRSIGWGWAYVIEGFAMLPCAIAMAWLPPADRLLARRTATAAMRPAQSAPLLSRAPPLPPRPVGTVAELPPPEGADADEEVPPSLLAQVSWLLCCAPYVLLVLGYAANTATVMGISTFAANFLFSLGLLHSELNASSTFGLCAALGGMLGTPLGGVLTDIGVRWSLRTANVSIKDGGERSRHIEMRSILGTITVMIFIASALIVGSVVLLYFGRYRLPFLILLVLGIATTYATASGISRVAMLLVPMPMRAFALALLTLNIHLWGDVPSPPVIGAIGGAWAPSCMGTPQPACLGANPDDEDQPYTHDQEGLLNVLLVAALYMFTSAIFWAVAYALLALRTRKLVERTVERTVEHSGPWRIVGESTATAPLHAGTLSSHPGRAAPCINGARHQRQEQHGGPEAEPSG